MQTLERIKQKLLTKKKQLFSWREEVLCSIEANKWNLDSFTSQNIRVVLGDDGDVIKLRELQPKLFSQNRTRKFNDRLSSGQILLLLKVNNDIAGYGWLALDNFVLGVGEIIALEEGEGAIYDARTFEKYRGCGVYKHFFAEGLEMLAKQGCEKVFSNYDANNPITKHIFEKIGFKKLAVYRLTRFFGRERIISDRESF